MHIALNGWFWGQMTTGSGQYLYHLVRYRHLPKHSSFEAPVATPNLLRRLKDRRPIRWPDPHESTWRAGIFGGLLLGTFI